VFRVHAFPTTIFLNFALMGISGLIMSARQTSPYDGLARKWLALAERRRAHVFELRDSGRWKHYYTPEQLLEAIREAIRSRDQWARIAGIEMGDA
jgi:hypothetical protein